MQVIKKLHLYILLAFVPSTIQATSTLEKIDQCLKYVEAYRHSKAIFHEAISQDIDREIMLYLPSKDRSRMRSVSASCYNTIESVDYQKLLMKINSGKVDGLDDKIIRALRKGDFYSTMSFFFNEHHNLCRYLNPTIPWSRVLIKTFPNYLFEYFEERYEDLIFSSIYYTENRKKFLVPFYKVKGLSKNKFPNLFPDMFFELTLYFPKNVRLVLECIKNYLDYNIAKYINEILPHLPQGKMSFNQLKQYLAIAYKAGYLPLFGDKMIEDSYCFRKIASMCLQNKQEGKKLLGELCYVAFHHNPTKESMQRYHDIRKYIKDLSCVYENIKNHSEHYKAFNEVDEVLSHLPKYNSLSLLTAIVAGLYKNM